MPTNLTPIPVNQLCGVDGCRLLRGHRARNHDPYPSGAWGFMDDKDKDKLNKAGFATPRGGSKGAYQNHVSRSNRVIVPYEKLSSADLTSYVDGYIIRLFPEQYFESPGVPKDIFVNGRDNWIRVGENAFVNYRSHSSYANFPPPAAWQARGLERNGIPVTSRGRDVIDTGHYTLRIPKHGTRPKMVEGAVQGIFAPEYATREINYLSKAVLAWLIIHTEGSPYTTTQAGHLKAILAQDDLLSDETYEYNGVLRRGVCACPLCLRFIRYEDLHKMAIFVDEGGGGEVNAADQVEGATRSTIVNLFHISPLKYSPIRHVPLNVGWGHHICNTRLGQRVCISLAQLIELNRKVAILGEDYTETLGWISEDYQMIRSPLGAVWIQIMSDMDEEGEADIPPGMDQTIVIGAREDETR
jgi:hypothetical protein